MDQGIAARKVPDGVYGVLDMYGKAAGVCIAKGTSSKHSNYFLFVFVMLLLKMPMNHKLLLNHLEGQDIFICKNNLYLFDTEMLCNFFKSESESGHVDNPHSNLCWFQFCFAENIFIYKR